MKSFEKIIGYEPVKKELYQIIDMFKNKEKYDNIGAKLPHNLIIFGPPGIGKTMLANALIEECNVKSFIIKKNKDDKETLDEINKVFDEAEKENKAIILIDDIDKFSDSSDEDVDDKSFAAIQSAIDRVKDKNILVVATANNYRKLPESLVRSGRFDRKIALRKPTYEDARKIIEFYMKDKRVDSNVNYDDIAKMINYKSCADLEKILNESAIYAAYRDADTLSMDDIVKAYLRSQFGSPDEAYECTIDDVKATALHECGHAVVAEVLKKGSVGFIYVDGSGKRFADGFTNICEDFKRRPENIMIALAGKCAVELFLEGRCGSGCQSDIGKAIGMLKGGISESRTCGLGLIDASSGLDNPSDSYSSKLETVIQAELERYMFIVRDILLKNKDFLLNLCEKLTEKKMLLYSEVQEVRNKHTISDALYY